MSREELIAKFGYDPTDHDLVYIGADSLKEFEFYYNPVKGYVNVNHFGCNGTYISGEIMPDGTTTLPKTEEVALSEVIARFPNGYDFCKKPWLGRTPITWTEETADRFPCLKNIKNGSWFDFFYDPETRSIDINPSACPFPYVVGLEIDANHQKTTLPEEFDYAFFCLKNAPRNQIKRHGVGNCRSH